jgi:hypothetical protein
MQVLLLASLAQEAGRLLQIVSEKGADRVCDRL